VLRQQLAILRRATPRPRLRPIDRAFWVTVARAWSRWTECLAIVDPATVIAWHRRGFARWWAWRSRPVGRPPLAPELVSLIEQMSRENPLWSRRRIASELAKLGHAVDKDTVRHCRARTSAHEAYAGLTEQLPRTQLHRFISRRFDAAAGLRHHEQRRASATPWRRHEVSWDACASAPASPWIVAHQGSRGTSHAFWA
jgi:hypothetical protein